MKHIIRYSNVQRITNENVAEHSFFVAANVLELSNEYKFSIGEALKMAIIHDMPEIYIDDVSHKVKTDFPNVKKALKEAEEMVVKEFSQTIQDSFYEFDKQETVESLIVSLADVYQCLQYANHEIALGNSGYMVSVKEESEVRIKELKKELIEFKRI